MFSSNLCPTPTPHDLPKSHSHLGSLSSQYSFLFVSSTLRLFLTNRVTVWWAWGIHHRLDGC